MTSIILCALADLPDPGAREFRVAGKRIFVVRRGAEAFAYVNSCPHARAPLNMEDDQFLDLFKESILCAMHFALFEIETGLCIRGPCLGRRLESYPIELTDGQVMVPG